MRQWFLGVELEDVIIPRSRNPDLLLVQRPNAHHVVTNTFSDGKESTYNAGDSGSIPGSGRSPGGGHGNPLQYSCLENPLDRGAWSAMAPTVPRVAKSWTRLK